MRADRVKRQLDGILCQIRGILGIVAYEFVDERGVGSRLRECEFIEYVP
jgi:hypothetical protein